MKIFRRLLRIARTSLLAILALYAVAALVLADQFKPVVTKYSAGQVILIEGETHDGICYNDEAMAAAGNWLARNGFTETKLSAR